LAILKTDKIKFEYTENTYNIDCLRQPEEHTKEHIFTRTNLGNKERKLAPISFPLSPRYVHSTQFPMTYEITADAVRYMFGTNIIQTMIHNVLQRILHITQSLLLPYGMYLPQTLTATNLLPQAVLFCVRYLMLFIYLLLLRYM
jgi:hypothetical protein